MELLRLIDKHDHEVNGSTLHRLLDLAVLYNKPSRSKQLSCERCLCLFFDISRLLRPTTDDKMETVISPSLLLDRDSTCLGVTAYPKLDTSKNNN